VQFDELARDGQPQSRAAGRARARGIGAIEALENALGVLGRDAGTVIDDVKCESEPAQSYALYLPSTYSADRKWNLLIAFHPAARLYWSSADTLATRTSEEYIARSPGKPAADEATGTRKRRIERVDVTGNAAIGKIVLDYPDAYIVDYMSLLKTNGEWKIINKIFMTEMKKK